MFLNHDLQFDGTRSVTEGCITDGRGEEDGGAYGKDHTIMIVG